MAKKMYLGINGLAKQVKKVYIGVNGVARFVKKGYIGVGNIARLFFDSITNSIRHYDAIYASTSAYPLVATSVGNYAIFTGGSSSVSSGATDSATVYDSNFTSSTISGLYKHGTDFAGTTLGNYAMFAGGKYSDQSGTQHSQNVDVFDDTLTKLATSPAFISPASWALSAASNSNYAVFGGGINSLTSGSLNAFNTSLVRSLPERIVTRYYPAAVTVNDHVLFCGGESYGGGGPTNVVESYDSTLVYTVPSALSVARTRAKAAVAGEYGIIAGGGTTSAGGPSAVAEAYDSSLTRISLQKLSVPRYNHAATGLGIYAMFGGGRASYSTEYAVVDVYDDTLAHSMAPAFTVARSGIAATTLGDYALFGWVRTSGKNIMDIYTLENESEVSNA